MKVDWDSLFEIGNCENCGQGLYHNSNELYDGQDLTCHECGCIHWFSADPESSYVAGGEEIGDPRDGMKRIENYFR